MARRDVVNHAAAVDAAVRHWRQGDVALGADWFVHVADAARPLSEAACELQSDGEDLQVMTTEVPGIVVLSQTCDVVRTCVDRPFVQVCPLVEVDDFPAVARGERPAFAFIPALKGQRLVASLDRVMTVEKSVLASWTRTEGCRTDTERRNFSSAVARKWARFAFPDDFTLFVAPLRNRIRSKVSKASPEGQALRSLREIRVRAIPSWDANRTGLEFWFIRSQSTDPDPADLAAQVAHWRDCLPTSDRFPDVSAFAVTLDDMTAADYVESDRLDLDHLSLAA